MIRFIALACLGALLGACTEQPSASAHDGPARRVVTLAPHLAEIMFEIGAGEQLVGVSAWSDYPPEVLDLPRIGDAFAIDQERLSLLQPDLLLVWESGMPAHAVGELRERGYRVESIRTRSLADIATAMRRIGELTGKRQSAAQAAQRFTRVFDELAARYREAESIDVFFEISARPLYTVNREHFVSEIIAVCGGRNVFEDMSDFAPSVSVEAVLERDPEMLLAGANLGDEAFADWARWQELAANRHGNHFLLPDDTVVRPSPRLAQAASSVCAALDEARRNRK
ncbi:MAG: ABC transporter substrate-binding protein [Gammaproteobacteria bacterium]|nr:ABC transporter substrate-binding protein [Gammaproteobacteria bacterium]MBT8093497.1 ABC transporter substrate-binding protein [Gammaproteobacteria bacterium]NNF49430.1 ABC transporter substrate-binding protein [Woeseiaceae bacterium]NNL62532.1 ABC transporter substrate-binding protein [Woeseiaceae bacterium]